MAKRKRAGASRASPDPRRHAIEVASLALSGRAFVQEEINARSAQLSPPDRRLLAEIAYGVVRRRLTLDCVLEAFSSRPLKRVEPAVLQTLRAAAFQILFMDRVPPHAAVNEAVRLTRATGHGNATGFVNAVLRQILRSARRTASAHGEPECRVPRDEGWALFSKPVLPSAKDRAAYLSAAYSYPEWAVRRWVERFGEEQAVEIMRVSNLPPRPSLRPNVSRLDADTLVQRLAEEGVDAHVAEGGRVVELPPGANLLELEAFARGDFQPQDDSAARVAPLLGPRPGERILDLCAAPGGKATHLAELSGGKARVDAVDLSREKLQLLRANLQRLGLEGVDCIAGDAAAFARERPGAYDAALLDAPCSNSGVLRRRAEARWRLSEQSVRELVEMQANLLDAAAAALKPAGRLVYSTCSLEPEENQEAARRVADARGLEIAEEIQTLPTPEHDGAYAALLRRREGNPAP